MPHWYWLTKRQGSGLKLSILTWFYPRTVIISNMYIAPPTWPVFPEEDTSPYEDSLSRFRRNCSPVVEEITSDSLDEVHDFLVEWCEWKDCDSVPFLGYEEDAVFFALKHFNRLGLSGLIIRVMGKIGAIALYEQMNPSTVVIHFEKGLPDCEGIYKAINAETAAALLGRFEYINRESDMGVEGLREAKTRYHPHHLVEVYCASKEDLKRCI